MEIAGATFDSSKDKTADKWGEKRHASHLPERHPRAMTSEGVSEVGGQVISIDCVRMGQAAVAPADPHVMSSSGEISSSESSDDDHDEPASHCMSTSSETSFSDDDDQDFLDLLVDTLDGDFDPNLFV